MPLLKPSASDFTAFQKANAQAFPVGSTVPKLVSSSAVPSTVSVIRSITRANAITPQVVAGVSILAQATVKTPTTKVYH